MGVRDAVEKRDQAAAAAPAQVSTATLVRDMITRQAKAFGAVLPEHVDVERYSRLTLVAIKANPKLMAAFQTSQGQVSVLLSAMQAAALGLEPNTPTQECWLQPRRTRQQDGSYLDECELSIGYKGYAKLARRSGQIKELVADVVREGDEFEYERGLGADVFRHKATADDNAPLTHAYAIARFHDGGTAFVVLKRAQVEKRRAMSESWKNDRARPYSPWTKWEPEMWCKTALRHLFTHGEVELSPELARAVTSDERPLALEEDGTIDALIIEDRPQLTTGTPDGEEPAPGEQPDGDGAPEPAEDTPPAAKPPASPAVITDVEVLRLASEVFKPARDAAPQGQKGKTEERVRHALTWQVTGGRVTSHKELTVEERERLYRELEFLRDGFNSYEVTDDALVLSHDGKPDIVIPFADVDPADAPGEAE